MKRIGSEHHPDKNNLLLKKHNTVSHNNKFLLTIFQNRTIVLDDSKN